MKKILALLLAVMLLPLCAFAEEPLYQSDFSSGTDGWYPRSGGGAQLTVTAEKTLMISGRAGAWHSPGRAIDLKAGTRYWFSVDVMQNTKDSADFILSVEKTKGGSVTYENLGRVNAGRNNWVTLYGTWMAGSFDSTVLYIETDGNPMMNFYIRDFRVLLEDPQELTAVTWEGELPSLKEVFSGRFDIGTCVSQADVRNKSRMALVAAQYNIVTPENEMKPDAVLDVNASRALAKTDDTAVAVHFDSAKPLLNWAKENGVKVHGHVLVWHSQTPEAFFHEGYDTAKPYVTREVMLARLDNYIRQIFEFLDTNYPGVVVSFDVANEVIADGSSTLRVSNWTKVVGADFVNRAFEIADRYAPDYTLLYYNDYSTPYEPKTTGIMNLLASLAADGHIDGYGFQSHYSWNDPSIESIRRAFDRVVALGLRLRVSELDIKVNADSDATREAQARRYAELFDLYLSYNMEAVQVWGVCDGTSWISANFPLLFDASLQPKPAFFAVVDSVKE